MKTKIKEVKKIETCLRLLIDLDIKQAKELYQEIRLLIGEEKEHDLKQLMNLEKSLNHSLDERQLY